jgi:hypothetical protein
MRSIDIVSSWGWRVISDGRALPLSASEIGSARGLRVRVNRAGLGIVRQASSVAILAGVLLLPAIINGFPLVFPDSGTYLGIATGSDYAIDRSSVYGLLLKPFVQAWQGDGGLWLAIVAQALVVALGVLASARTLLEVEDRASDGAEHHPVTAGPAERRRSSRLPWLLMPVLLTSLPWHAGQFMPDAFTGPLVLIACLAATQPPSARGAALLWLVALVLALTHYTHVVLLAAVASTAILVQIPFGLDWRGAVRRLMVALFVSATAAGLLAAANGAVLGRPTMSPAGPVFLFARLHEDGLIDRWLDRHCGDDAPAPICVERNTIARDSQTLLWRDPNGPVSRHIWHAGSDAERWRWVEMMATANRGAILEQPTAFLASAMRGTARQLVTFRALDDECPENCGRDRSGGVGYVLVRDRPGALAALDGSMQLRGTTPKSLVRAVTTPVAGLALLLLPVAIVLAWRRRDRTALAFTLPVLVGLVVNAALAGALSDVHDRYQSRIVWLAPFLLVLLALRWRGRRPRMSCPLPPPGA